jgi:hypothetical protein
LAPRAGLVGLTHGKGAISGAIRFGQRLRFPAEFCKWNHAFLMVDEETLIEMGGHGAQQRQLLAAYSDTEHVLVDPGYELDLDFARWALQHHAEYGYMTIASLAASLMTGTAVEFGVKGRMICSGLVAACANEHEWKADPSHVTPAEVALKWWTP